jgi:hypothetical protein
MHPHVDSSKNTTIQKRHVHCLLEKLKSCDTKINIILVCEDWRKHYTYQSSRHKMPRKMQLTDLICFSHGLKICLAPWLIRCGLCFYPCLCTISCQTWLYWRFIFAKKEFSFEFWYGRTSITQWNTSAAINI